MFHLESATSNGDVCKIPFKNTANSEDSYFCVSDTDKFVCETTSGEVSTCSLGMLL